jgi:hypothetical protein
MKNWRARYEAARREERSLHRIALHEAAHACANYLLGVKVEGLVIGRGLDDDDYSRLRGLCRWETADGRGIDLKTLIITSLAGPCTDWHFFGAEPNYHDGDYNDAQNAARKLAADGPNSESQELEAGRQAAEALVVRHADVIKALARQILDARWHEMDGRQVEGFLARAGVRRAGAVGSVMGFERRGGVVRPSANPDPLRKVAVFERRCDGYVAREISTCRRDDRKRKI